MRDVKYLGAYGMGTLGLTDEYDRFFDELSRLPDINLCIEKICSEFDIQFVTYHLAFHEGKAIDSPYVRTNYPATWVSQYLTNDYVEIDPVAQSGFKRALPCLWSELDWSSEQAVSFKDDAQKHGIGTSGYLVPITDRRRRRAIINFASPKKESVWADHIREIKSLLQECAEILHRKAIVDLYGADDEKPALSPREIQCLTWVAQGKDASSIGLILGISEHTVRDYCKSAKHKLGCASMYQAIHKATMLRIIDPDSLSD